jgi:acetyl-CoA synthetase
MGESETYPPPAAFAAQAYVKTVEEYERLHRRSIADPEGFWGEIASGFHFFKKWDRVLKWNLPRSGSSAGRRT